MRALGSEYLQSCFFTKLSGIDPCEKRINILGGHAWQHFLWLVACRKLEAMAVYLVKQAFGNDKLACVHLRFSNLFFAAPLKLSSP